MLERQDIHQHPLASVIKILLACFHSTAESRFALIPEDLIALSATAVYYSVFRPPNLGSKQDPGQSILIAPKGRAAQ